MTYYLQQKAERQQNLPTRRDSAPGGLLGGKQIRAQEQRAKDTQEKDKLGANILYKEHASLYTT